MPETTDLPGRPDDDTTAAALAVFLNRPGRVLLAEDYQGDQFERMRAALAASGTYLRTETQGKPAIKWPGGRVGLGKIIADVRIPTDIQFNPDVRVDAAYQRGIEAGRAQVTPVPVETALGQVVDEELRQAHLRTLAAQRRHAEVAAEGVLEQSDLSRSALDLMREDVASRREADPDRLTPAYVVRRDAVFAAIAHADALARHDANPHITGTQGIEEAIPYWEAILEPPVIEAKSAAPEAVGFAERLIGASGRWTEVESIRDTPGTGTFRVSFTDGTELDVAVRKAIRPV